jgi:RNA polymerase sigma-70 factor (ECF subfamily)
MSNSEKATLEQIVSAHLTELLHFATRLTGNPDAAEEIVQEAMVRVVRSWSSFRREAQVTTWLKRIVINVFRDRVADRPATEPIDADFPDPRETNPAAHVATGELGGLIAARVSALPPRQREVLVLITYEGLSVEEVAKTLEISVGNVHATLHAARRSLRIGLASYFRETSHEK